MKINHHIHQAVLAKLSKSEMPVRYSELKPGDIENSLFSYHLDKLVSQGIVDKSEDGYSLTVEGARWLHNRGGDLQDNEAAHVFVSVVVVNKAGKFLVGQRTGQFRETINDYILPSIRYSNEIDMDDQISNVVIAFVPENHALNQTNFGFVQIKANYSEGVTIRNLFSVSRCEVDEFEPMQPHESTEFEWLTWAEIEAIEHPSAVILRKVIEYTRTLSNQRSVPTIEG